MATTYLKRVIAADGSNTIGTISAWVKRGEGIGSQSAILGGSEGTDANNRIFFGFWGDGELALQIVNGGTAYEQSSAARYKDPAAWYHVVARLNTGDSTAQDRIKLYVNGTQVTAYLNNSTFPDGVDIKLFENTTSCEDIINARKSGSTYNNIRGGMVSHLHVVDGTAYDASTFGETDSTSGIWIPKPSPTVTYGTNGFFLKFENSSNMDLDSGTNAFTNFTTVGTVTATKDNPVNNFCTLNPVDNKIAVATFSNGLNTVATVGSNYCPITTTYGLTKGKWYWELKQTSDTGTQKTLAGITGNAWTSVASVTSGTELGNQTQQYGFSAETGGIRTADTDETYGSTTAAVDDIIQCYIDLDASKIYFAVNDTLGSSTGYDITAAASTLNQYYVPAVSYHSTTSGTLQHNFGNGYFGTTVVTSSVADAGDEGSFEYDPSRGGASDFDGSAKDFRALCSNNLATYG
jgi:hypothetical protein